DRRGNRLQRGLAVLDQIAEQRQRQVTVPLPLLFQDDLRERDRRQVLAGLVLDDLHVLAGLHPASDLVEGDVPALTPVVPLSGAVPLHETWHGWQLPLAGNAITPLLHVALEVSYCDRGEGGDGRAPRRGCDSVVRSAVACELWAAVDGADRCSRR